MRWVLSFVARHVYGSSVFPNPCFSITSRVRTGPAASIICWLWYQTKVAGGLELTEQDRLKLEPDLMTLGGFGGVMVTSSGPSVDQQRTEREINGGHVSAVYVIVVDETN